MVNNRAYAWRLWKPPWWLIMIVLWATFGDILCSLLLLWSILSIIELICLLGRGFCYVYLINIKISTLGFDLKWFSLCVLILCLAAEKIEEKPRSFFFFCCFNCEKKWNNNSISCVVSSSWVHFLLWYYTGKCNTFIYLFRMEENAELQNSFSCAFFAIPGYSILSVIFFLFLIRNRNFINKEARLVTLLARVKWIK